MDNFSFPIDWAQVIFGPRSDPPRLRAACTAAMGIAPTFPGLLRPRVLLRRSDARARRGGGLLWGRMAKGSMVVAPWVAPTENVTDIMGAGVSWWPNRGKLAR